MNGERLSRLPQVLFEIGKAIGSDEDLGTLLTNISELLTDLLGADACSVMLLDVDERRLLTKAAHGLGEGRVGKLSFAVGEGVAGWVVERGQPALIDDVAADDRFVYLGGDHTSIKSMACVPLLVRGKSVGVLTVTAGQPAAFNATDIEVLEFVAKTIGLDVENIRLHRLSVTDPLTGAYNRRYLMEQLPREIDRASRYSRRLSAIMCDVDHFKKINDTHGHLTGDEVLRWFVNTLRSHLRKSDWIARYGGEEFVIVLPETNAANAAKCAELLRQHVSSTAFKMLDLELAVSASFGAAGWQEETPKGASFDALIAQCDAGVYASKAAGRNCVTSNPLD